MENNKKTNTIAIIGFIASFFTFIIGLVLSIIGFSDSKRMDGEGRGLALAGIIISAVKIGIIIIQIVLVICIFLFVGEFEEDISKIDYPNYSDVITDITYDSIQVYDDVKDYIIDHNEELDFVYTNIENGSAETRNMDDVEKQNIINELNDTYPVGLAMERRFELVDEILVNYFNEGNFLFKIILDGNKSYIHVKTPEKEYVYLLNRKIIESYPVSYN